MASFNNQSFHRSYTYNNSFDQVQNVDTDQTLITITDLNYANASSMNFNDANYQPPSQVVLPSDVLDHNDIYTDMNEPLNTEYYEYTENNENRVNNATASDDLNNYNSPSIYHPAPQTSGQTQPTSTFSNNAIMMTIATSHGQAVLTMNSDINLEGFLFIIQSFVRVERIYR